MRDAAWLAHRVSPRDALAALASGVLMAAAQCWGFAGWLSLVALVPLLLTLRQGNWLAVWLRFGIFNAACTALTIPWIRHTGPGIVWFIPIGILYTWLFLAIPALFVWLSGTGWVRWLALPPAMALTEVLQRSVFFQLHWILMGQPLADYPLAAQAAAIGGPETLTLIVVACNVALAAALIVHRKAGGIAFGTILVLTLGWGGLNLSIAPAAESGLRAGIVQPMISQKLIWTPQTRGPLLERINGLIDRAAAAQPDLIVLPESAIGGLVRWDQDLAAFATQAVRRTHIPILFGSFDYDKGRFSVAAFLIATDGRLFTYRKRRLVPFVEYTPAHIPYTAPSGWLRFTPGEEAEVFRFTPDARLGPMICLEDILPDLARDLANHGATLLTVLINTENFAGSSEALQHLRRARLTAISVGLPMLRAANSGISGVVDSRGRMLHTLPAETSMAQTVEIPLAGSSTLYRVMGDVPVMLMLAALLGGALALARRLRHSTLNAPVE